MSTLRIGNLVAESGTKAKGSLHVLNLAGNWDARIPTILINGKGQGPILNLHAGIHGDEYEGIRAIWEISEKINPEKLTGSIIATPIVHTAAYAAGLRESPIDGKNLARVFPGDKNGTSTDKLAYFFFHEVVLKSNYMIGLHSGGYRYKFHPLVEYYHGIEKDLEKKEYEMAKAFAIGPFNIIQRLPVEATNVTCTFAASQNGVAAIEPEMWGEGRCLPEHVTQYKSSIFSVMAHLGMIEDEREKKLGAETRERVHHVEGDWILANSGGLFIPTVEIMTPLKKDQRVGITVDDFGSVVEEMISPTDGFVGALRTFPMIRPGDWGVLVERPID
ncbi:MAG TPA: succinylglutamate desuccinylase/aspartoacylase family protein [Candidatus Bathyarchaeia archaeon]|nr:succinylglutamate desuccinylase/aspartoacylase family protein [Candidatus Bathyarchaeia archaeon]